jgi:hypothetical protein
MRLPSQTRRERGRFGSQREIFISAASPERKPNGGKRFIRGEAARARKARRAQRTAIPGSKLKRPRRPSRRDPRWGATTGEWDEMGWQKAGQAPGRSRPENTIVGTTLYLSAAWQSPRDPKPRGSPVRASRGIWRTPLVRNDIGPNETRGPPLALVHAGTNRRQASLASAVRSIGSGLESRIRQNHRLHS